MLEPLHLWLTSAEAVWVGVGKVPLRVTATTLDETIEAAFGILPRTKRRRWPRRRVCVRLAGALAQPFVLEPIAGLRSWRELEAAAATRAAASTGLSEPLRIDLSRSPQTLGIAASEGLTARLLHAARANGLRVVSAQPWWLHRWRPAVANPASCLWVWRDPSALTVLVAQGNLIQAAFAEASKVAPPDESALIQRLRVAYGANEQDCSYESWEERIEAPLATGRRWPLLTPQAVPAEGRMDLIRREPPSRAMWAVPATLAMVTFALHLGTAAEGNRQASSAVSAVDAGSTSRRGGVVPHEMRTQLDSDWPQLLASLEAIAIEGITCESLDIDTVVGKSSLRVSFTDYAALGRYIGALNVDLGTRAAPWSWSLATAESTGDGQRRATLEARRGR